MKVLLLTSYCGEEDDGCSDDLPCSECIEMCNIVEVKDDVEILSNLGGLDYNRTTTTSPEVK